MSGAQNPGFKDSQLLVNTSQLGLHRRRRKAGSTYNYALRSSWGTSDRFRGVMGRYWTEYDSTRGKNFKNYASTNLPSQWWRDQVGTIPLVPTVIEPAGTTAEALMEQLGPLSCKYIIELDNAKWNQLMHGGERTKNFLRKVVEEAGIYEGDPQWKHYLKTGATYWTTPISPIFNTGESYLDHTFYYTKPSANKAIKNKSGMTLNVESVYNYYAATSPPYEVASLAASEPMLPNFYCLESEIRNTGSTVNSQDYFDQITLAGALQNINIDNDEEPDPWFQSVEGQEGSFTESKTTQFYTLYSKGISQINSNNSLQSIQSDFDDKYKNIVILNSDLNVLEDLAVRDDESSGLKNLTFYNKITIGTDYDAVDDQNGDYLNRRSFLSTVMEDLDLNYGAGTGDKFIDILQLYIVQNFGMDYGTGAQLNFKARSVTRLSATSPQDYNLDVQTKVQTSYFGLEEFLADIETGSRIEALVDRIEENATKDDDNFILIRNYNQFPLAIDNSGVNAFREMHDAGDVQYPDRKFPMIYDNKRCYNEPVLYVIEKRVVDASSGALSEPIQTFFISKSFPLNKEIHYIDSQVKYGVRYHYSIKQVRLVFGNKYSYEDLKLYYSIVAGNGRAVGNALGFYREPSPEYILDDLVDAQIKQYTPDDEDLSYSSVGIEGPSDNPSIQTGYYIFKMPPTFGALPESAFASIFNGGTGFVRAGDDSDDATQLQNLKLTIKEGFGFTGNESGGAVGQGLILPTVPVPQYAVAIDTKSSAGPGLAAGSYAPSGGGPGMAAGQMQSPASAQATGPSSTSTTIAPNLLNQMFGGN